MSRSRKHRKKSGAQPHGAGRKVAFVSLGCAKNLVDSEKMLGQIVESGCLLTSEPEEADVIVVNTCGFLEAARIEAHEAIAEAIEAKRAGPCRRVVVAGCLVQRDRDRLLEDVPGIDALVGVNNRGDIVRAIHGKQRETKTRGGAADIFLGEYHPHTLLETARLRLTPRHYAYLRISEGCDQKCTFCTIPAIRGTMHSKPIERILDEARELIGDGAVELNLIGQDTTSYGKDLGNGPGLPELLASVNKLDGLIWGRLMYAYPSVFTDEMIDALAECEKIAKYVDIPLQHINDRILRAMNRRVTRAQTETLLRKLRDRIPGLAIRTTLISGFPGETDAEHDELVAFVRDFEFDALGVFPYSHESDTPAGRMKDPVPAPFRRRRTEELMLTQQEVVFRRNAGREGRCFEVLIDGPPVDGLTPARCQGQAPQVDAVTRVAQADAIEPGSLLTVRCTGYRDYDLLAVPADVSLPVLGPADVSS